MYWVSGDDGRATAARCEEHCNCRCAKGEEGDDCVRTAGRDCPLATRTLACVSGYNSEHVGRRPRCDPLEIFHACMFAQDSAWHTVDSGRRCPIPLTYTYYSSRVQNAHRKRRTHTTTLCMCANNRNTGLRDTAGASAAPRSGPAIALPGLAIALIGPLHSLQIQIQIQIQIQNILVTQVKPATSCRGPAIACIGPSRL